VLGFIANSIRRARPRAAQHALPIAPSTGKISRMSLSRVRHDARVGRRFQICPVKTRGL
jgi:hypothetical protein